MSTQYLAVKTQAYDEVHSFQRKLDQVKNKLIKEIGKITVTPELEETKEDLIDQISVSSLFSIEAPENASVVIGTARAGNFSWRSDNGFRSIDSVAQWLQAHPEFTLFDEYGCEVSWEYFQAVVECCQSGSTNRPI